MIPDSLSPIANHLWQSTLFACAALLLTLALRKNSARVRHWIWVAASVKFLVPLAPLVALGSQIQWRTAPPVASSVSAVVEQVGQPFTAAVASPLLIAAPEAPNRLPKILFAIWACGFIGTSISWLIRWRRIAAAGRGSRLVLPFEPYRRPHFLNPVSSGWSGPCCYYPKGSSSNFRLSSGRVFSHMSCATSAGGTT